MGKHNNRKWEERALHQRSMKPDWKSMNDQPSPNLTPHKPRLANDTRKGRPKKRRTSSPSPSRPHHPPSHRAPLSYASRNPSWRQASVIPYPSPPKPTWSKQPARHAPALHPSPHKKSAQQGVQRFRDIDDPKYRPAVRHLLGEAFGIGEQHQKFLSRLTDFLRWDPEEMDWDPTRCTLVIRDKGKERQNEGEGKGREGGEGERKGLGMSV